MPKLKKRPILSIQGPLLTVILALDQEDKMICALCPELDLVVESPSESETLQELLEAMQNYAEEYQGELNYPRLEGEGFGVSSIRN